MKIQALCIDGIRRMAEVNQENTGRVTFKNAKTKGRVLHAKFHGIKKALFIRENTCDAYTFAMKGFKFA